MQLTTAISSQQQAIPRTTLDPPLVPKPPKNYDSRTNGAAMADVHVYNDSRRRSTRVVLKIVILVEGVTEPLMCDGVTLVVNRHGALISAGVPLRHELKIKIQVVLTGMRANAKVVHIDPERPQVCGIALEKPENIWDLPSPPDDWRDHAHD